MPSTPFHRIINGQTSGALPKNRQAWGWSKQGYKSESLNHLFLSSLLLLNSRSSSCRVKDLLFYWNNSTNADERIDNKGKREEPGVILERLAKHASRYSVNLDGFVSKVRVARARGGFAIVWSGTLRLQEAKAVVNGLANNGFLGNGEIVKVILLLSHNALPYSGVS